MNCGVCKGKRVVWVAAMLLPPRKPFYGWECQDCGAYMDVVGGKNYWQVQVQVEAV